MQVTDEQVKQFWKAYHNSNGSTMTVCAKVALESLQIAPPTEEEVRLVYAQTPGTIVGTMLMRDALRNFVNLRNNPPKPDPRREAIKQVVSQNLGTIPDVLADKILKALDEVK